MSSCPTGLTIIKSDLLAPDHKKTYCIDGPDSIYKSNVVLFSKPNLQGNMYLISNGSYTSDGFIKYITPDNVFSMSISPETTVKLFCGDNYDSGTKGSFQITNVLKEPMYLNELPQHIQGYVKSVIITRSIYEYDNISSQVNRHTLQNENFGMLNQLDAQNYISNTQKTLGTRIVSDVIFEMFDYLKIVFFMIIVIWIGLIFIIPEINAERNSNNKLV
jgi:hypothetical protein